MDVRLARALALAVAPLAASVGAGKASAGAWTPAPGKGLEITSISREVGDFGETWRSDIYSERGFAKGWALQLDVASQIHANDTVDDRTAVSGGVRRSFALGDRSAAAVQVNVLAGEALDGPECTSVGYEVRGALGTSHAIPTGSTFLNVEGGWRNRGDACSRSVAEVAMGADVGFGFRALGKAWREEGDGARSVKVEGGLYFDYRGYSLGAGYREEVSGDFDEKGWVVSLWRRF